PAPSADAAAVDSAAPATAVDDVQPGAPAAADDAIKVADGPASYDTASLAADQVVPSASTDSLATATPAFDTDAEAGPVEVSTVAPAPLTADALSALDSTSPYDDLPAAAPAIERPASRASTSSHSSDASSAVDAYMEEMLRRAKELGDEVDRLEQEERGEKEELAPADDEESAVGAMLAEEARAPLTVERDEVQVSETPKLAESAPGVDVNGPPHHADKVEKTSLTHAADEGASEAGTEDFV
ncbi:uncharacterized protein JCM10292_000737, partial [Rhodotorula paludigena]|uniref:uncharacterized protein n=1 Tax=Rhodotorula paludigena TaxID=86838 RepID=UPI00317C239A